MRKPYLIESVQSTTPLNQRQSDAMNTSAKHVTPQLWIPQLLQLDPTHPLPANAEAPLPSLFFSSDAVKVDHDNILSENIQFHKVLQANDDIFNPTVIVYDSAAGSVGTVVNMGPIKPPQRNSRIPQYSRDKLVEATREVR